MTRGWAIAIPISHFKGIFFGHKKLHALRIYYQHKLDAKKSGLREQIRIRANIKIKGTYSDFENHICWKEPNEANILPPIQTLQ